MTGLSITRVAIGLCLTACTSSTDSSSSPLSAAIRVDRCGTTCGTFATGVDSAAAGDSVWIGQFVYDSSATVDSVTERDGCALNAVFLAGQDTVLTVPNPVTCPGQVIRHPLSHPLGDPVGFDGRFYRFLIPTGLAPGTYHVRGLFLEEPVPDPEVIIRIF
jgi:hypothetical protein